MRFYSTSILTRACNIGPFENRKAGLKKLPSKIVTDSSKDIDVSHLIKTGEEIEMPFIKYQQPLFNEKKRVDYSKIEHRSLIFSGSKAKKVDLAYGRKNMIGSKDNAKSNKNFERKLSVDGVSTKDKTNPDMFKIVHTADFDLKKQIKSEEKIVNETVSRRESGEFNHAELNECTIGDMNFISDLMQNMNIMRSVR